MKSFSKAHTILMISCLAILLIPIFHGVGMAHEPIFGLGPHVIYKGGLGIEVEYEQEKASDHNEKEKNRGLTTEMIYGITANLAATIAVPYSFHKEVSDPGSRLVSSGLGDVSMRLKYRFWRHDLPGIQDSAAIIAGVKLPTGDSHDTPRMGSGSTDFLMGFAAARESLKWYYFGDARVKINTEGTGDLKKGNLFFADVAIGLRAWPTEYLKPDLVLMTELNWETQGKDELNGRKAQDSGGNQLFISPGFFFTYRNWALKGGVQLPIYQSLNGEQPEDDYRFSIAVEIHY